MSNRRLQTPIAQSKFLLVGLFILTVLLTLALSLQPFDARALQGDSPLPTDTHTPTFTPVPAETDTPIPEASATPTFTPVPADTGTPIPTATPLPAITPDTPTPTISPTFPAVPLTAAPPLASQPITIPLTSTIILTTTGVPPAAPPENSDTLVLLIDTLVLYSAYFFLGCGFIVFIVLVLGFILLHRRAKALQEQDQPPQPPGV